MYELLAKFKVLCQTLPTMHCANLSKQSHKMQDQPNRRRLMQQYAQLQTRCTKSWLYQEILTQPQEQSKHKYKHRMAQYSFTSTFGTSLV
jgi:hypothetical protein